MRAAEPAGYLQDNYWTPTYDEYVVEAVRKFQNDQGLSADGVLGPATWEALEREGQSGGDAGDAVAARADEDDPTLHEGDHHHAAEVESGMLRGLGYYQDYPDPYYGTYHVEAGRRFQEAQGMTADGVLGPRTWEALRTAGGH